MKKPNKEQALKQFVEKVTQLPESDVERLLYVIKGMELSTIGAQRTRHEP